MSCAGDAHDGQNSDVRMNDLAFSLHCNLCSTIMLAQILMYTGDGQRITPVCWASTGGIFLSTEVGSKNATVSPFRLETEWICQALISDRSLEGMSLHFLAQSIDASSCPEAAANGTR